MNVVDLVRNWARGIRQADAGDTIPMHNFHPETAEQILAKLNDPEFKKREAARTDFSASINQIIAAGQFEDLVKIRAAFKGDPKKQNLFQDDQIRRLAEALEQKDNGDFDRRKFELFVKLCDSVSTHTNHTLAIADNIMREKFLCEREKRGDDLLRLSEPFKSSTAITPNDFIKKAITLKTIPANSEDNIPTFTLMFCNGNFLSAQTRGGEILGIDAIASNRFLKNPVLKALRELRTDPLIGPSASAAYTDLQNKIAEQILNPQPEP